MTTISQNVSQINQNILEASAFNNFPEKVTLVAVSKGHSFDKIIEAFDAGIINFGENYLQEALNKKLHLENFAIQWHFLGPIQSNKCKLIAENFDWVHSVDRLKVMKLLNDLRPSSATPLNICIQINLDEEETKSGINLSDLESFSDKLLSLENLRIRGLMALPKQTNSISKQKNGFSKLSNALNNLRSVFPQAKELSMGMSDDLVHAIAAGSTMIRVGSALFGSRK